MWLQQGVGDLNISLNIFKKRITNNFQQTWHNELHESPRAIFYRAISEFHYQEYLETVTVKKIRIALSKLHV